MNPRVASILVGALLLSGQTALRAGAGGFDINVNGTTHRRGGVITSSAAGNVLNSCL